MGKQKRENHKEKKRKGGNHIKKSIGKKRRKGK
jgi:hypothetical protein